MKGEQDSNLWYTSLCMLEEKTTNHFNSIASTWEKKEWVNSSRLNNQIDRFIRSSERTIGLQKKRHKTSLYFGIGTGALFTHLKRYNIAGVDEASQMLGKCPEGIIQILSNVAELPFLMDDQFNLVFSRNLLKHCPEPLQAIESMYRKTRPGSLAIATESVVFTNEDKDIPTKLVRMTDPSHPPFRSVQEIVKMFEKVGFSSVEYIIIPYRSAWLKRWIEAEQASVETHKAILEMYKTAPKAFKERHSVVIDKGEIISTVPWLMIRAVK